MSENLNHEIALGGDVYNALHKKNEGEVNWIEFKKMIGVKKILKGSNEWRKKEVNLNTIKDEKLKQLILEYREKREAKLQKSQTTREAFVKEVTTQPKTQKKGKYFRKVLYSSKNPRKGKANTPSTTSQKEWEEIDKAIQKQEEEFEKEISETRFGKLAMEVLKKKGVDVKHSLDEIKKLASATSSEEELRGFSFNEEVARDFMLLFYENENISSSIENKIIFQIINLYIVNSSREDILKQICDEFHLDTKNKYIVEIVNGEIARLKKQEKARKQLNQEKEQQEEILRKQHFQEFNEKFGDTNFIENSKAIIYSSYKDAMKILQPKQIKTFDAWLRKQLAITNGEYLGNKIANSLFKRIDDYRALHISRDMKDKTKEILEDKG